MSCLHPHCFHTVFPSIDVWTEYASAEGLLLVYGLQGQMQDLHQPAGGNGAFPSASRRVRHHPHGLWTPSRGRVHSQGLLWEEEHLWVSIAKTESLAIFGGAADVILGGIVCSKIAKYSKALKWRSLTINVRKPNVSAFPHREAENIIGLEKIQVCNVIVKVVGLKQIHKFTFDVLFLTRFPFPFTLLCLFPKNICKMSAFCCSKNILSHWNINLNLIYCESQLCSLHISSILFFKSLCPVLIHTVCPLTVFPTRVTNKLLHSSFPPFHLISSFYPSLSYWPSARQEKEREGNACM